MFGIKWGVLLLKYVLPVVGIAALLFGMYEWGHSKGYTEGNTAGYQTAWNTQQQTINKMQNDQNTQNTANNNKIAKLEQQSATDAQSIAQLQQQLQEKRTTVITKYVKANPQSSQTCGFDAPMVQAINQLIEADPSIVGTSPAPDGSQPDSTTPTSPTSPDAASSTAPTTPAVPATPSTQ